MTLYSVRGLDQTTEPFRRALSAAAAGLEVDPTMLAAIISFETGGSFRADIRNPKSGAVGLIQFLPSTARLLGTNADALSRLSPEDQLPWVVKYLRRVARGRKLATVSDFYAAVFAPKFIGAADSVVLYRAPSQAYAWNKGLDRNQDGAITKGEASAPVRAIYETARARGPLVERSVDPTIPFLLGVQLIRLVLKL